MAIDQLLDIPRGSYLTLHCATTNKPIYFNKEDNSGRKRFTASAAYAQLAVIPYQVSGKYVGIEGEGEFVYAIVEYQGEAAILSERKGCLKVVGREIRQKTAHVPIGAIKRAIKTYALL